MFEQNFVYTIIKKDGYSLAIPNSFNGYVSMEISALYKQGFVFCCEITAPDPVRAVEIYNEMIKSDVMRLEMELSRLQAAYYELQRQNESLKRNSSLWSHESSGSFKNFELFGFSEYPEPNELEKRYKSLRLKLHPDKNGDKQLFQLVQNAYQALTKT